MTIKQRFFLSFIFALFFVGCATSPLAPRSKKNICEIFREQRSWYDSASESSQRWGIPIPVLMAIIYHESGFNSSAAPPRESCLCIFPGFRASSAYGYAQALDSTWDKYKETRGRWRAKRQNFDDAVDFVGWYCHISHVKCNIQKNDTYNLYLAYHEGHGGFNQKSYQKKRGLRQIALGVQQMANSYERQFYSCKYEFLKRKGGCCLLPF